MSALLSERVSAIKALAHPTRLQIAEILSVETTCVSQIHEQVGGDLSTVSKHLSIMRQAGWLTCHKKGLQVHYTLACACLDDFFRCIDSLSHPSDCC